MFQECLVVLRSIVLHSLGITSQSSEQGQYAAAQRLSSQISSQTQAKPSVAASEENNSSPASNAQQAMKSTPRNKMGHKFMTPSPNSRISSGFGSLQDEEGSIEYESSYDHKTSQHKDHSDSQYPQRDPNLIKIEQRSQEHERKRRRRHKHHRHRSHDPLSEEGDLNNIAVSPQNATAGVQRRENDSNPPPPKGAWDASLTTPTNHLIASPDQLRVESVESSSDGQTFPSQHQIESGIGTSLTEHDDRRSWSVPISRGMEGRGTEESVQSPSQAKMLSPRAEKQRQKLHSKQVELLKSKEEKERLANEVNLLNLKVLEEGTK